MVKLLLLYVVVYAATAATGLSQRVHSIKGEDSCDVANIYFGNDGQIEQEKKIIEMLGVRSCSELNHRYQITTSGYYLMRGGPSHNEPVYRYCDFELYSGVATCSELVAEYNISKHGYYRLGNSAYDFQYCPDAYTCHHIAERDGISESGFYDLGPPGQTYKAYCNFFVGQAITEVRHGSMHETAVTKCQNQGCFSYTPQYEIDIEGILNIMKYSKQCRQFVKYRCQGSVLLYYPNSPYGYWISRDGEKMRYWGGATSKRTGNCACGETGTCLVKTNRCNCDQNGNNVMTQDDGYLTDKSKLPVKELKFGDTDDSAENGWYTLGSMECSGEEA